MRLAHRVKALEKTAADAPCPLCSGQPGIHVVWGEDERKPPCTMCGREFFTQFIHTAEWLKEYLDRQESA